MTLMCPHCSKPIPEDIVVRSAAAINARKNSGKGSRPGAKGLIRNPAGPGAKRPQRTLEIEQATVESLDRLIEAALSAQRNS